jgi:hypothetical protein
MRPSPLATLATVIAVSLVLFAAPAEAACGVGTPFPQCDDVCPPGLVCANNGGTCGCVAPTAPCQDPLNPNGPPVCYGSCPNPSQVCATLAGGCACIPTLGEWAVIGLSMLMLAAVLWRQRGMT